MKVCAKEWGDDLDDLQDEAFNELLEHADVCPLHALQLDAYLAEMTPLIRAASPETAVSIHGLRPLRRFGIKDYIHCWHANLVVRWHPTIVQVLDEGFRKTFLRFEVMGGLAAISLFIFSTVVVGMIIANLFKGGEVAGTVTVPSVTAPAASQEPEPSFIEPPKAEAEQVPVTIVTRQNPVRKKPKAAALPNPNTSTATVEVAQGGHQLVENGNSYMVVLVPKESVYVKTKDPNDSNYAPFRVPITVKGKDLGKNDNVLCSVELKKDNTESATTEPEKGVCSFWLKSSEEYQLLVNGYGLQTLKRSFAVSSTTEQNEAANLEKKRYMQILNRED